MLEDYHAKPLDFRASLKKNRQKTRWVIFLFVLIYLVTGLLIDSLHLLSIYPEASFGLALSALLTGLAIPWVTLFLGAVALISIWVTFLFYDKIMLLGTTAHEITLETAKNLKEKQLYHVVLEMKIAAGLQFMPKVFLIEAPYMNAFASGYSERSAMVAITGGLLEKLNRAELKAVMAHELSHIRHLDIKLTLTAAVLGNLLLVAVDFLFYSALFSRGEKRGDNRLLMVVMLLRYALPIVTVLLSLFLSRTREYMADAGCVALMRDNEPLAKALLKISEDHAKNAEHYADLYAKTPHEEVRQAAYLFDPSELTAVQSITHAFATHPSLEARLKAIGFHRKNK